MKNLPTYNEFVNEARRGGVNVKTWLKKPEIAQYAINRNLAEDLMKIDGTIEWHENELDWGLWDLAGAYGDEAYDDKGQPDPVWYEKKKKELAANKKKLEAKRRSIMKSIIKAHPHVAEVEEFLGNRYMYLAVTRIDKINPGMKSIELTSWDMYDKTTERDLQSYNLTMPQLIATILSMRAVKQEIAY